MYFGLKINVFANEKKMYGNKNNIFWNNTDQERSLNM